MTHGIPLTDADRAGWLEELSKAAFNSALTNPVTLVACSALKLAYRDVFRSTCKGQDIQLYFLYLRMTEQTGLERVKQRKDREGHYMPTSLVYDQFATLQEPGSERLEKDCFVVESDLNKDVFMHSAYTIIEKIRNES